MAIILFLLFASRSCSGRVLENNLFTASDNPSTFNPILNSVVDDGSRLENDAVLHCGQDKSPWSGSSQKNVAENQNKFPSRLSPAVVQNKNMADEPLVSDIAEAVFRLLPRRKVRPSGASPIVNSMVTEQRLSKSKRSPGVGHMQIVRHKSQTTDGGVLKAHHSNGDDRRNKQSLRFTSIPGRGH